MDFEAGSIGVRRHPVPGLPKRIFSLSRPDRTRPLPESTLDPVIIGIERGSSLRRGLDLFRPFC